MSGLCAFCGWLYAVVCGLCAVCARLVRTVERGFAHLYTVCPRLSVVFHGCTQLCAFYVLHKRAQPCANAVARVCTRVLVGAA